MVDVPINVQLPPKIPANEIGINKREEEKLYFSDNWVTILMNMITTAVVLIKAEILAEINMKAGVINISGNVFSFFTLSESS
ncbi:hypothetical protein GCM10008085_11410 [Winogradskyella epiphytica]|nr:hypothetical protein GCM10008085_11410 [Winogradskyella epiphytica]